MAETKAKTVAPKRRSKTEVKERGLETAAKHEAFVEFFHEETGVLLDPGDVSPRDVDRLKPNRRSIQRLATKALATLEWHLNRGNLRAAEITVGLFLKMPPPPLAQRVREMSMEELQEAMRAAALKAGLPQAHADQFVATGMGRPGVFADEDL